MPTLSDIRNRYGRDLHLDLHQIVPNEPLYRDMRDDLDRAWRDYRVRYGCDATEMRVDSETQTRWLDAAWDLVDRFELTSPPTMPSRFRGIPIIYGCERFEASCFRPQTEVFVVNQG